MSKLRTLAESLVMSSICEGETDAHKFLSSYVLAKDHPGDELTSAGWQYHPSLSGFYTHPSMTSIFIRKEDGDIPTYHVHDLRTVPHEDFHPRDLRMSHVGITHSASRAKELAIYHHSVRT